MLIPLKVTTDYSLLKSMIKIDELISYLNQHQIPACGICDEYLYGTMEFYNKCIKNNIKPIIGLDVYVLDHHIYLYAKNYQGYQTLLKLNTIKTERDLALLDLELYHEEILVIIPNESLKLYDQIKTIFKDVYLGYQNEEEKTQALLKTKQIVFINDIRALSLKDSTYLNYLEMMRLDIKKDNYTEVDFHRHIFIEKGTDFDVNSTIAVSELLNVTIPKNENHIPKFNPDIKDSNQYLENLTHKGLKKRFHDEVSSDYWKRLDYELSVIKKMGFSDYILIVYDYVLFAKKNNILVGPGRGSAAGSLVCYTLGITDIDPLKYNLLFERFLNPERVTMPDIDIDFENTKRSEVINYIKNKYGNDKVASIMTFATLKSKLVLREVAKVMDITNPNVSKLYALVESNLSLQQNLQNQEVVKILKQNPDLKQLYQVAMKLEGLKKNISTHAAGVVISNTALETLIPIIKTKEGISTGITMEYLEELGLLKMDLLAIKNLTIIENILELIYQDVGKMVNISQINLNDPEVLELFAKGDTTGIFQFESNGMRSFLKKLKPRSFSDLVAALALYRPGPMDNINSFIRRKEKKEKITYIIPELEPILKETEGIIVYQEQVMQILVKIANYSYAEADLIRRAMSKKKKEVMEQEKQNFITRASQNGYGAKASQLYDLILKFANYGFNKSHSVAYALIGYQMAYLKVKFPKYFITNLLNMSIGSEIKTNEYILEAKRQNLIICKPHINKSTDVYQIIDGEVILPLSVIKGLNGNIIKSILTERDNNGLFLDFIDFCKRMYHQNMNERLLLILIRAGVFQDFGSVMTLQENLEAVWNYAELASSVNDPLIPKPILKESNDEVDANKLELESYGFYISNHPTSKYTMPGIAKLRDLAQLFDRYERFVVLIEEMRKVKTKTGVEMAFLEASDDTAVASFVVFSKQIRLLDDLKIKDIVEIQGRVTKRYDKYQINVNNIIKKE